MNVTAPRVSPLFAVPFAESRLPDCERLNAELERLFLAREGPEYRNPSPSHVPQQELFESGFDLFQWPEPCVQQLRRYVLESVARVAAQVGGIPLALLPQLAIHHHAWYHVTRRGGSFVAHNHPMASWSAVYCVRGGESVSTHPDSGLLRFFDPRAGADAFVDAVTARVAAPYAVGAHAVRLEAGQLVVFPSYLVHEVTAFHGGDARITVAANCWFEAR